MLKFFSNLPIMLSFSFIVQFLATVPATQKKGMYYVWLQKLPDLMATILYYSRYEKFSFRFTVFTRLEAGASIY